MARLISSLSCILILPLLLFPMSSLSKTQNPENQAAEVAAAAALFIFGDSFFDSDNNNYINTTTLDHAKFWLYGEIYFKFPTGRFSDGCLISDFIGVSCCIDQREQTLNQLVTEMDGFTGIME